MQARLPPALEALEAGVAGWEADEAERKATAAREKREKNLKIFDEDAWVEVDVIPLRPEGLSR